MKAADSVPTLERLLSATIASRDAFTRAAFAATSPGLSALFVHRAEYQTDIASYLMEQLACGGRAPRLLIAMPGHREARGTSPAAMSSEATDPHSLLGECIRVLDAALLEFRRAYGPAITMVQCVALDRHRHQMGWAREELLHLQSECVVPKQSWRRTRMSLLTTTRPGGNA